LLVVVEGLETSLIDQAVVVELVVVETELVEGLLQLEELELQTQAVAAAEELLLAVLPVARVALVS
jgi:hypothetical protein